MRLTVADCALRSRLLGRPQLGRRRLAAAATAMALVGVQLTLGISPAAAVDTNDPLPVQQNTYLGSIINGGDLVIGGPYDYPGAIGVRFPHAASTLTCCSTTGGLRPKIGLQFGIKTSDSLLTVYSALSDDYFQDILQSDTSGQGTVNSPWRFNTSVNFSSSTMNQIVTHVEGTNDFDLTWEIQNGQQSTSSWTAMLTGDIYANDGQTLKGFTGTGTRGTDGTGRGFVETELSDGTKVRFTQRAGTGFLGSVNTPTGYTNWIYGNSGVFPDMTTGGQIDAAMGAVFPVSLNSGDAAEYGMRVTVTPPPAPETPVVTGVPQNASSATTVDASIAKAPNDNRAIGFQCSLNSAGYTPCTGTPSYTGLAPGEHRLRVRTVNSAGLVSTPATKTWTIAGPPGKPEHLAATQENTAAVLTWTSPASNGGLDIDRYEISTNNGPWVDSLALAVTLPGLGAGFRATMPELVIGTPYTLRVRAVTSGFSGEPESSTLTLTSPPGEPRNVQASPGNASAGLSFTIPVSDGGSEIVKYQASVGSTWVDLVTTANGSSRTATLGGLTNGQSAAIYVRAVNDAGPGTAAGPVSVTPVGPAGAPTDYTLWAGNTAIGLRWKPPISTGGSAIESYELSRDGGQTIEPLVLRSPDGGFENGQIDGLTNNTAYTLIIRAVTSAGPGAWTAPLTATPYRAPLPGSITAVGGTSSITASWTPASPTERVARYLAYAVPGPAYCETESSAQTSCVLGAEVGKTYQVFVMARGFNGSLSTPVGPSGTVSITPPPVPGYSPPVDPTLSLTTDQGDIEQAQPGQELTILGEGFAPHSTAKVIVYSTPVVLATVVTDSSGDFSAPVTVPANLPPGFHTFVASGVAPDGELRSLTLPITVPGSTPGQQVSAPDISSYGRGDVVLRHDTVPLTKGSVLLVSNWPEDHLSVRKEGIGRFFVNNVTGRLYFDPDPGWAGRTRIAYVVRSNSQHATGWWTVSVTKPAKPLAPALTSSGEAPTETVTVPRGGGVTLLDANGDPASSVTIAGQGTYTVSGGQIAFRPVDGFTGEPTAVKYRVSDAYGQSSTGTYQPTVWGDALPKTGDSPVGLVTVGLMLLLTGLALVYGRRRALR